MRLAVYPGSFDPDSTAGGRSRPAATMVDHGDRTVSVLLDSYLHRFRILDRSEAWAADGDGGGAGGDTVVAPFPGSVAEVHVEAGQSVAAGQICVVIEAMKMLHTLTAPIAGIVAEVTVAPGDQVASNQSLVTFDPEPASNQGAQP